ncbi:MAG: alpha/beta hydrolase fold domain-containing protein [Bulleidia sp.]
MMEIKDWTYAEYPAYSEQPEGVVFLPTTGDEKGTYICSNVEYAVIDGHPLHLQIITPASRNTNEDMTRYPCLVYVQGSAWFRQNINAKLGLLARYSERGYVIAVVEYRDSSIASFPAVATDTRNAIRFMKVHGAEYKADIENMYVGGDSSGGHAAMFSQIIDDDDKDTNLFQGISAKVKGIISFYGASSMMLEDGMPSTLNHHLPDSPEGKQMGGVNLREHPELCRAMSVECNVDENTDLPKVLMFHGTKDRTINPKVSVVIYQKLTACGKDAKLYMLEGADHGGPEFWSDTVMDLIEDFMK